MSDEDLMNYCGSYCGECALSSGFTALREAASLLGELADVHGLQNCIPEAWTPDAEAKAKKFEENPAMKDFTTMMVKTHLSLSHDPALKGVPKKWVLPIRDVLVFAGAGFLCPCAGAISLMPGTSSDPAFRRVDVDVKTGKVQGLF